MSWNSLDRTKQSTLSGFVGKGDAKRRKMDDMTGTAVAGPAAKSSLNMLKVN